LGTSDVPKKSAFSALANQNDSEILDEPHTIMIAKKIFEKMNKVGDSFYELPTGWRMFILFMLIALVCTTGVALRPFIYK
jgi:hypothetical protein